MKLIKIRADEPITRGLYFEADYVSPITIFDLIADHQQKLQIEPVTILRYSHVSPRQIALHYGTDNTFIYVAVGTEDEINTSLLAFAQDPQYTPYEGYAI